MTEYEASTKPTNPMANEIVILVTPYKTRGLFALLRSSDTFASMTLIINENPNKCARYVTD